MRKGRPADGLFLWDALRRWPEAVRRGAQRTARDLRIVADHAPNITMPIY
jgi:hypothetical protein